MIPLHDTMARDLADDLRAAVEEFTETQPYAYEIRGSNQPFCPRQFVYAACQESNERTVDRDDRFFLYCDMGTAVHEVVQRAFASSMEVYCSWECKSCDKKHDYDWYTAIPHCCDDEMQYVEFAMEIPEIGMKNMHVDVIIRWRQRVIVIEIKTTARMLREPSWGYILQANLYTNVLHPILGATHFSIYYVDRAFLRKTIFTYERNEKLFETQKYIYQIARWGAEQKQLVPGICSSRSDMKKHYLDCPFVDHCFSQSNPPTFGMEDLVLYYMGNGQ